MSNNELFLSETYQSEITDLVTGHRKKKLPKHNPYLQLDVTSDEMVEGRFRSRNLRQSKQSGASGTKTSMKTIVSWLGPRGTL